MPDRLRLTLVSVAFALVFTICAFALASAHGVGPELGGSLVLGLAAACTSLFALKSLSARPPPELSRSLTELEQRIEQADETRHRMRLRAETAGRFREEFVAAVRHELKTPLNAILGFTEVLLEEIDGPLSSQQREDVEAIRGAGLYLKELVEAVLEEVPDRGPQGPLARVDLGTLVTEVARMLEGQVGAKSVTLRTDVDPETPHPLADARRLRQVLINLGTNALRATSRGEVAFAVQPHPDGVVVTVRDSGRGIASEDLPQLFSEFTQLGPHTRRVGGSGLGLALSRDMVEWHGGRLEVESKLGEGSAFHVILPLEAD